MLRVDRYQDAEAPWTASRCNRTLRQLTVFLAKIEKWHKDFSHRSRTQNGDIGDNLDGISNFKSNTSDAKIDDPNWLCRPNRQSSRKAGKSYARRRKPGRGLGSPQQPKCLPYTPKALKTEEVIIDTPMMTCTLTPAYIESSELLDDVRVSQSLLKSSPLPKVALLRGGRGEKATKEVRVASLSRWSNDAIDEMKHIVSTFLAATSQTRLRCDGSGNDLAHHKGSKSLFSTCLYRIPSFIITEQSQYDVTSDGYDGDVQVASALLTDLEDHYSYAGKGWGPLRLVTRAYGIALICDAIRRRFLHHEAATILASTITDCFGANEATFAIAQNIVEVRQVASADDLGEILSMCIDVTERKCEAISSSSTAESYAAALRFCLIDMAFRRTSGPTSLDLISDQPTFLKDAIKCCSQGQPLEAVSLVKTLLLHFLKLKPGSAEPWMARLRKANDHFIVGLEDQAVGTDSKDVPASFAALNPFATNLTVKTFRSGLVALTALPISRKMRHRQSSSEQLPNSLVQCASICILRDICLAIQVDMEIHGVIHLTKQQFQHRVWMVFAYILLAKVIPLPNAIHLLPESLLTLIESCESRKGLVTGLSSFILEIVTACDLAYERGERVHSLSVLKEITKNLRSHTSDHFTAVTLLFSNTVVEASMAYVQTRGKGDPDALLWATELQHQVQESLSVEDITLSTPSLKSFGAEFRWDECISEWVAKTPSVAELGTMRIGLKLGDDQAVRLSLPLTRGLPTPSVSTPDSPIDESMSRRTKKRKGAPEQTELLWDGDFAFRRPPKKGKLLEGQIALPDSLAETLVDLESEDELNGGC